MSKSNCGDAERSLFDGGTLNPSWICRVGYPNKFNSPMPRKAKSFKIYPHFDVERRDGGADDQRRASVIRWLISGSDYIRRPSAHCVVVHFEALQSSKFFDRAGPLDFFHIEQPTFILDSKGEYKW